MLISTSCIKKIFPNDIGSARILKSLHQENKIKIVSRKKIVSNLHTLDNFKGAQKLVTFYNAESIEKAVANILAESGYKVATETKEAYARLLDIINKLRELENTDDTIIDR